MGHHSGVRKWRLLGPGLTLAIAGMLAGTVGTALAGSVQAQSVPAQTQRWNSELRPRQDYRWQGDHDYQDGYRHRDDWRTDRRGHSDRHRWGHGPRWDHGYGTWGPTPQFVPGQWLWTGYHWSWVPRHYR